MPAFALRFIDPEGQSAFFGFVPEFSDEAVPLVHVCLRFNENNIGHFCPNVNSFRTFLSENFCNAYDGGMCRMSQEGTIRRGVRNARYATIPNHVFEDDRLSMGARWLLGYLLSKPDNWTVVTQDICNKGKCGRDKARSMIAELVETGYAEREQLRDDGKFGSSVLVIYDEPLRAPETQAVGESVASLPQTEKPATGTPSPVSPSPGKPAHSNNSDSANTDDQEEREGASAISGSEKKPASHAELVKRVQRFVSGEGYQEGEWPKWSSSTIGHIVRQFEMLTGDEQEKACRHRDAFLAKCRHDGVKKPMPVANYFRDKVWEMLATPAAGAGQQRPEKVPAPPFGPLFGAVRAWLCLPGPDDSEVPLDIRDAVSRHYDAIKRNPVIANSYLRRKNIVLSPTGELIFPEGFDADERRLRLSESGFPAVNAIHEKAKIHQSAAIDARFVPLKDLCEPVPVDSDTFADWLSHDERHGWPRLPDPGRMNVVWFPKGGPAGLAAFEEAAKAILDGEGVGENEHAA